MARMDVAGMGIAAIQIVLLQFTEGASAHQGVGVGGGGEPRAQALSLIHI